MAALATFILVGAGCGNRAIQNSSTSNQSDSKSNAIPNEESVKLGIAKLVTKGESPSARYLASSAFDSSNKKLYVFGGQEDKGYSNELYELDTISATWRKIDTNGNKPSPRFGAPLMFDAKGQALYLFGGQGDVSPFLDDVWRFDLAANAWEKIDSKFPPEGRYGHGGIFDEINGGPVIFGGFIGQGRSNETWRYNIKAQKWENLSPDSTRPQKRCLLAAGHYSGDNSFWIFGGQSTGVPGGKPFLGDLWRFDLKKNKWEELKVNSNVAERKWPGLAALKDKLVIFGGESAKGNLNDTWIYDLAAKSWTSLDSNSIEPRNGMAMAADEIQNTVYLFGGLGRQYFNDVWAINL